MHLGRESSKIVSIQTHSWAISSHDPCFIIIIFIHFGCFQLTQDVKHQLFRQQQIDAQQAQLRAQARSARHCKTLRVHGHDLCTVLEYLERCFAALVPFLVCSSFFTCCFAHAGSAGTPGPTSCSKPCSSSGTSCTAGPTAGGRARKGLVTWRRASWREKKRTKQAQVPKRLPWQRNQRVFIDIMRHPRQGICPRNAKTEKLRKQRST